MISWFVSGFTICYEMFPIAFWFGCFWLACMVVACVYDFYCSYKSGVASNYSNLIFWGGLVLYSVVFVVNFLISYSRGVI